VAGFSLTKTQRNAVFSAIQAAALDPSDFSWQEGASRVTGVDESLTPFRIDVLVHRPTGYFFLFDLDASAESLWAIFRPGRDGAERRENAGSWGYVYNYVVEWLSYVKREHEAPDLWALLQEERDLVGGDAAEELENTQFSLEEQNRIAQQLNEAKAYVHATYELTSEQGKSIDAQLDYLVDAAKRQGRIDWRNLVVGTLLSLVLQAVLPPEAAQSLLTFVLRSLAGLFGVNATRELTGGTPDSI
jgi:hypothetical protein